MRPAADAECEPKLASEFTSFNSIRLERNDSAIAMTTGQWLRSFSHRPKQAVSTAAESGNAGIKISSDSVMEVDWDLVVSPEFSGEALPVSASCQCGEFAHGFPRHSSMPLA